MKQLNLLKMLKINQKIIEHLEADFQRLLKLAKDFDIESVELDFEPDAEEKRLLGIIRRSKTLKRAYEKVNDFENKYNKSLIIRNLVKDIKKSLKEINQLLKENPKPFPCQILFLEYDYEPYFYWCGFGEGDYPVLLEEKQYLKYNFNDELFNGAGKIGFKKLFKPIKDIDKLQIIHILSLYDLITPIRRLYMSFVLLCLAEAIAVTEEDLKKYLPLKLPMNIYVNEHDCEQLTIFRIE